MTTRLRLMSLVLVFVGSIALHGQPVSRQFWFEADVYHRLSNRIQLLGILQSSQDRNLGTEDLFAGAFVDFGVQPILRPHIAKTDFDATPFDFLRFRTGIAYLASTNASDPTHEVRGILDLTPRYRFDGLLFTFRNRTEYRLVQGNFDFRYRARGWVEHTFYNVGEFIVTPFFALELFYSSTIGSFYRLSSQVGVSVGIFPWFAPDLRYVYQVDWNGSGRDVNAINLTLAFYI